MHKKTVAYKYLRTIIEFEADTFNNLLKLSGELSVKPGQKLCYDCFNACSSSQSSVLSELSELSQGEVDKSYHDAEVDKDILNAGLVKLVCSPLNSRKTNDKNKLEYGKWKVMQVLQSANEQTQASLDIPEMIRIYLRVANQPCCQNCKDLNEILNGIKDKIQVSSKRSTIRLLTLVPSSWTIEKTKRVFEVTSYMVKQARKLKTESGYQQFPEEVLVTTPSKSYKSTMKMMKYHVFTREKRLCINESRKCSRSQAKTANTYESKRIVYCF